MKIRRILALLLVLSTVFGLAGCKTGDKVGDDTTVKSEQETTAPVTTDKKDGETDADADAEKDEETTAKEEVGDPLDLSPKAVWSDMTVVTKNMFVFFFNANYRYFLQTNSGRLESLGLDPEKSLSSQKQSEKYNWQQYFTLEVYRQLREMIALVDAAKEAGISLDGKDRKEIDEEMATYRAQAEKSGYSEAEFYEKTYGKDVTATDIRACIELRYLANKYYTKTWESYEFSDGECSDYYEKNRDMFLYFDCITNTVPKDDAKVLLECKDPDSFLEAMKDIVTKNNFSGDYEGYKEDIDKLLSSKTARRVSCDSENETVKWALEKGRQAYDVHSAEGENGMVTVTMLLPCEGEKGKVTDVLYRDEVPLKNVMCMIFGDSEGTSGLVKANTIYKNWQEEPTEDRFGSLMLMYNGSKTENVYRTLLNSKVDAWLFSADRKDGDCTVIEEEGGAYLVYKLPDSGAAWLYEVREHLKEEAYADEVDRVIDKYPTKYEAEIVYNVIEVEVK